MIEVEVEADAWTAALPEAEAVARAAAEAALAGVDALTSSPPALPGEGRGPRQAETSASEHDTSASVESSDGHGPRPSPGRAGITGDVAVLLTDDASIRELNRDHRGQDKPTNVLSFPAAPSAAPHLGDVALAFETCAREAAEQGKTLEQHLQHLVAHGVLHLLGWDHMTEAEAQAMEERERVILAGLGAPDPYRDRDLPEPPSPYGRPRQ